jgi:RNA polymerase sigma-70 factor (ECF subfamily)
MQPSPDETVELLGRWHAGEDDALHRLIERHLPEVRQHVHRLLGDELRRKDETGDFVQDTMLELLRYSPRFQVENARQFHQLVIRIIENVLRDKHDWYRRKRRAIDKEQPLPQSSILQLGSTRASHTPGAVAERHERQALVRLALELLEDTDRQIIILREYDGLSYADLAEKLGVLEPAVRMRLSRALSRLGEKMRALRAGDML